MSFEDDINSKCFNRLHVYAVLEYLWQLTMGKYRMINNNNDSSLNTIPFCTNTDTKNIIIILTICLKTTMLLFVRQPCNRNLFDEYYFLLIVMIIIIWWTLHKFINVLYRYTRKTGSAVKEIFIDFLPPLPFGQLWTKLSQLFSSFKFRLVIPDSFPMLFLPSFTVRLASS